MFISPSVDYSIQVSMVRNHATTTAARKAASSSFLIRSPLGLDAGQFGLPDGLCGPNDNLAQGAFAIQACRLPL